MIGAGFVVVLRGEAERSGGFSGEIGPATSETENMDGEFDRSTFGFQ